MKKQLFQNVFFKLSVIMFIAFWISWVISQIFDIDITPIAFIFFGLIPLLWVIVNSFINMFRDK